MRYILAVLLIASTAFAGSGVTAGDKKTFLNAVHANAAAGSLTFTVPVSNGPFTAGNGTETNQIANLYFNFDYTDGATAVTMTCSASDDKSTLFVIQSCAVATGVCTSTDASWSKAISAADKKWIWRVDLTGMVYASCVVAVTGGTANEHVTVTGWVSTK